MAALRLPKLACWEQTASRKGYKTGGKAQKGNPVLDKQEKASGIAKASTENFPLGILHA